MGSAVAGLVDAVLGVVREVGLSDDVVGRYGKCCGIVAEFCGQRGIDVLSSSVVDGVPPKPWRLPQSGFV
jgi:hypothetical protein